MNDAVKQVMRWCCLWVGVVCLQVVGGEVDELQDLGKQWLDVKREAAALEADWQREEAALKEELALVEARRKELANHVGGAERFAIVPPGVDAAGQLVGERRSMMESELVAVSNALEELRRQIGNLPTDVQREGRALLSEAPKTVTVENLDVAMGAVVRGYVWLVGLNREFRLTREVLTGAAGEAVQVEVLYVGRPVGFAVSMDGKQAALGRVGDKGWEWVWQADHAAGIQQAIGVYKEQQAAELVILPLSVSREKP